MTDLLEGKTAIVTGAAHGVGRAAARRLARAGARVVASDRDHDALARTVAQIVEDGGQAVAFACDMRGALSASNLIASTLDAYGRLDILVNAARSVVPGTFPDGDDGALQDAFDANVRSAYVMSRAAARRMIAQAEADPQEGRGRCAGAIVNISSIAAQRTIPELLHYSVSCAALDQMTRAMAVALAPHRIRVNAVALGSVMTASLRDALRERAELREELVRVTPLGRIAEPDEAAEAVLYLASERSSFVTGQVLSVDGGRTVLDPLSAPAH
ncbi:SDR family NAD(P)-dependent oxidoreductase [Oceanicella actignis]|uniref:7-alpha-hydroxysteroid dehydrogenase n=1 Tax=Oceanicella actignis TaxID=1189325 RepID=A0A1M7TFC1_9RHOB|nr:glucose 1-dehydrogenase [Oceanicella actignis]TYO88552.1 7-alpha-hydroxysteroid dehydrogenase [Oceanicella actignis]SET61253.1 7-alpha-hydroxysteroid dehydrogenase [Oceanicella actignis]SHN69400.1 7-alpha-hydroxysteroid dehydrogenase [Oceanicella actignis]